MASLLRNNSELAKEWHPTKNGSLTPADLTLGSNKRVWWICSKGHEWQARGYTAWLDEEIEAARAKIESRTKKKTKVG